MSHIIGKVYDLTQKNMQKIIAELDAKIAENTSLQNAIYEYNIRTSDLQTEIESLKAKLKWHEKTLEDAKDAFAATVTQERNVNEHLNSENQKLKANLENYRDVVSNINQELRNCIKDNVTLRTALEDLASGIQKYNDEMEFQGGASPSYYLKALEASKSALKTPGEKEG